MSNSHEFLILLDGVNIQTLRQFLNLDKELGVESEKAFQEVFKK